MAEVLTLGCSAGAGAAGGAGRGDAERGGDEDPDGCAAVRGAP